MNANTSAEEKSIVAELDFSSRTVKRLTWGEWEFSVVAPFTVEVTNASYGHLKGEHTYEVMVDERGRPVTCSCPGYQHHHKPNGNVGKHMLALAAVGGSVVLQAAIDCPTPTVNGGETTRQTLKDKLRADGGAVTKTGEDSPPLNAVEHRKCTDGQEWCEGPEGEALPCLDCFEIQEGR